MKFPHFFLMLILVLCINQLNAKNYYVSTTLGNNSNTGSLQAPFKTIQKAADVMNSGDICYIFGGVYRETIVVKDDNVLFKNYDSSKVIVSGTVELNNWTPYKDGIYKSNYSGAETEFTMLFVDFKRQEMARWPNNTTGEMMNPMDINSGYTDCRVYSGVAGQKSRKVTFDNISNFPDNFFVGGIFRGITGKKWINPMGYISASKNNELTVDAITDGWIENSDKTLDNNGKGHGFIFHLNALDIANEWFQKDDLIYYKPEPGKNPNNLNIEYKKRKWAFQINDRSGVVIDGIHIHAASIELKNSNNCKVLNSSVQYMMPFLTRSGYGASYTVHGGIYVKGNDNEFKNCYVAHSWGNGFSIEDGNNTIVDNCIVEDVGWIAQFTSNIQNNGFNTIVKHSTFGSSGRFHIRTDKKVQITYNDFYDCMKMGQDAGSIQCTNGSDWGNAVNMQGAEIAYNRLHDSSTLTNGTKQFVLAFYLEGCYNYTVHHNLIYNFITDVVPDGTFTYLGPRKSKIIDCYYYNNTVWNVNWGIRIWNRDKEGAMENIRFWNNIFDNSSQDDTSVDLYQNIDFQNNYKEISKNNQNALFVDAATGDFRLKKNTSPINTGKFIEGITTDISGDKPDIGAIEYGSSFPEVGSNLNKDNFLLHKDILNISKIELNNLLYVYPIPSNDIIYINGKFTTWKILSIEGQLLKQGKENRFDISSLSKGVYFLVIDEVITRKFLKN
ncbi:T9SS type A sorting domain-containing protein [Flavobacterium sp.]|uniref:T9SS type A sorting domain-containing protein n=1 Tax=Flavobacterium sp. TaxID=239 RepID=UPI003C521242